MTRRGVSGMAACALALGMVVLGGGAARAEVVCEERRVGAGSRYVQVFLCVTESSAEAAVYVGSGPGYLEARFSNYRDEHTGEVVREICFGADANEVECFRF